jgi:hypothetical protein
VHDNYAAVRDSECVAAKDEVDVNIAEKIDELHAWAFPVTKKSTSPAKSEVHAARTSPELPFYLHRLDPKPMDTDMIWAAVVNNRAKINQILEHLRAKESRAKDAEPIPDVPNKFEPVRYQQSDLVYELDKLRDVVAALKRRAEKEDGRVHDG